MPSLDFKGKAFVYAHHLTVPFRELVPDAKKSWLSKGAVPALDGNLIIHGDNLHALKALLPLYAGKVDCVFIDPPYNTGNEGWCYNDNVRSPVAKEWLKKASPVDREDLERHDKWACMMWPRLKLLNELMAEHGVIFISIGDEELHRLTVLMDEIFGIDRQLAVFTRLRKKKGSNLADEVRNTTDYVLAYRKSAASISLFGDKAYGEKAVPLLNRANNESILTFPAGAVEVGVRFPDGQYKAGRKGPAGELEVQLLDSVSVAGGRVTNEFRLKGRFRWSQEFLEAEIKAGSEVVLSADFRLNVYRVDQENRQKAPPTLLTPNEGVGTNEDGSEELAHIFSEHAAARFDYPKPSSLVEYLVRAATRKNLDALVLDSFGGSGTTAQAVLAQNKKDGGNRRFILATERADAEEFIAFQRTKGKVVAGPDWCLAAWNALAEAGAVPAVRKDDDTLVTPGYIARADGLGRPIPNLCVKVPTGGGKTLLGCAALETLLTLYTNKQTGLVLWVIPTDAIFRQTWKAFANRESGYRQRLERASGGKIKLLRKDDAFTREDTETHLCVMLIMLQAGAIREDSKDKRKLFQDSGRYPSFFPEVDDGPKNKALLETVPNLDRVTMDEDDFRGDQVIVRQSLNNVFRLLRPLVVMDEGHKAYGKASFDFLTGFNPSFILELSATPNGGNERVSNVVVNVTLQRKGGLELERHLFEVIYQKQLNGLEQNLAWYLDADTAVKWWHRIAVQQDWHLQGWQRQKVYPDFLVCLEQAATDEMRFAVLETKGMHLKGNDDTEYKKKLFDLLTAHSASAVSAGELKLGLKKSQLKFELMLETDWQQKVPAALS